MQPRLVTLIGSNVDVLPFMLEHYRHQGVTSFSVNVHLKHSADPVLDEVRAVTGRFGCDIGSVGIGDWQTFELSSWLESMHSHPDDWWILADQDEFHEYPDQLASLLTYCDERGYNCIRGAFVDRISEDGTFPPIDISKPLWAQYPLGGLLSPTLLRASFLKIIAAKGHVPISVGHHRATSAVACPIKEVFIPVHHFKWTAGVIERLRQRVSALRHCNAALSEQSARFVRYCEAHGNRVDVSDRRLLLAPCEPSYPHWTFVTDLLAARLSRIPN